MQNPAVVKNTNLKRTLRDRLTAFHRKPPVLPATPTAQSTTNPPPSHPLQGTLQFATLIAMPSPRTSKLYNTPVNTPCNLPYLTPTQPPNPPIASDNAHATDRVDRVEVSETVPGPPPPAPEAKETFLSTFHIGVCTKPLALDRSLIPSPPPPPSPESDTEDRDAPFLPVYRIGYAGGAGVMIVQAPHQTRDEEDEDEWRHEAWMWRAF
jgi:hypothetical protein